MRRAVCASSSPGGAAAALVLCVLSLGGCAAARPAAVGPVTSAHILLAGGDTPPPDSAAWQPVSLPDDWSRTRAHIGGDAWYRIRFDAPAQPAHAWVVYVPRLSMVGTPFVNGARLAEGGRFEEPLTRLWYEPQLHWIPPRLLHAGTNVLHYRLRAYPDNQGGLSEVYVGPADGIVPRWRAHVFRQVTAMQITAGITAAQGVLMLVAWSLLGRRGIYGYFGLAALFWTLHATLVLTIDIPVPVLLWEVLIVASLIWVVVSMMMFALRFAGLRRPWLERGAVAYSVLAPLALWGAGVAGIFGTANVLLVMLLAIGVYEFKILADVARRERSVASGLLVGAAVFVLALGTHDWLNRQGAFGYAEPFDMHYGVPVVFAAVFWNLLSQARAGAARVEATAAERERIMRDIHDGVGSQLITARQLAANRTLTAPEMVALLDECIDDLRLMIDSLEPADGDIVTVLGNLRYRLTHRLVQQGLTLRWQIEDAPPLPSLTPRDILDVLRVVQEAVTNVLKHAQASEVVVSVSRDGHGRHASLRVRDNGRGLPDGSPRPGRGLSNMRHRAAALGGSLTVETADPGTIVTLHLPLARRGPLEQGMDG